MGTSAIRYRTGMVSVATAAAIAWMAMCPARVQAQATGPVSSPSNHASALPLKKDDPADAPARAVLAWAVVLVIAAAGAGFVLVRSGRLGRAAAWGRRPDDVLRRCTSLPLAQHASVHVVQWGNVEYLLGTTPQGVTLVDKRPLQRIEAPDDRVAK